MMVGVYQKGVRLHADDSESQHDTSIPVISEDLSTPNNYPAPSVDLVQADCRSMCEIDGRCVYFF